MTKQILVSLAMAAMMALATTTVYSQTDLDPAILPSKAIERVYERMGDMKQSEAGYYPKRRDIAVTFLPLVRKDGLNRDEHFQLGELYFMSFMPVESKEIFETFLNDQDLTARIAWERYMQIEFRAEEKYDKVEKDLERYRSHFSPDPSHLSHLYNAVINLANFYSAKGEHSRVVQLIDAEVATLPKDAPYWSLSLPGMFYPSYAATGRTSDADRLIKEIVEGISKSLKQLEGSDGADEQQISRMKRLINYYNNLDKTQKSE